MGIITAIRADCNREQAKDDSLDIAALHVCPSHTLEDTVPVNARIHIEEQRASQITAKDTDQIKNRRQNRETNQSRH